MTVSIAVLASGTGSNLQAIIDYNARLGAVASSVISLVASNWFFLLGGAAVVGLLALRTPTEEANLLARFGAPYQEYLERTGRFLPKILHR